MLTDEQVFAACAAGGSTESWREFVKRFQRLIATVALRIARQHGDNSGAAVDEVVQETFLHLCADSCAAMRGFVPRHEGAVYGFLKVLTANVAHDHYRGLRAVKRGGDFGPELRLDDPTVENSVPDTTSTKVDEQVLIGQVHAKLDDLLPGEQHRRDRLIFVLYFRQGLTARSIASISDLGLSTKGVETVIVRTVKILRQYFAQSSETSPGLSAKNR